MSSWRRCSWPQREHADQADIIAKDDAREICETLIRQYAGSSRKQRYRGRRQGRDRRAAGQPEPRAVECPQTSPLISIVAQTPGMQSLRYADSTTPDSRAKPFGASELQLFRAIGRWKTRRWPMRNFTRR
jgi:hypothetical protein